MRRAGGIDEAVPSLARSRALERHGEAPLATLAEEVDDPRLIEKARDRWYVPDPSKQAEREAIREKSLLREFDEYKTSTQRKLKVFRTEAVRVGFKACWQERDYGTIVKVAEKLPDAVLQEDEKLLMYYDNALTREGG